MVWWNLLKLKIGTAEMRKRAFQNLADSCVAALDRGDYLNSRVLSALQTALINERGDDVRAAEMMAYGGIGQPWVVPLLGALLMSAHKAPNRFMGEAAANALGLALNKIGNTDPISHYFETSLDHRKNWDFWGIFGAEVRSRMKDPEKAAKAKRSLFDEVESSIRMWEMK